MNRDGLAERFFVLLNSALIYARIPLIGSNSYVFDREMPLSDLVVG